MVKLDSCKKQYTIQDIIDFIEALEPAPGKKQQIKIDIDKIVYGVSRDDFDC